MQYGISILQPPAVARAVHEAIATVDAAADSTPHPPARVHLAQLAAGRFDPVRERVRTATPSPDLPLIAARYTAWTGDLRTVAAAWAAIRTSMQPLLEGALLEPWLRHATFSELQRTATDVGDPAFAAVLHRHATRAAEAAAAPAADHGAAADGREPDLLAAADLVLDYVHGTLGVEPDATRHRLRLRPLAPAGADRVEVRSIRFGDGAVNLSGETVHDADGMSRHVWTVAQEAGAIPTTVLLEPIVNGAVITAAVDGRPAQLAPRSHERGTIVPVQLVLDDERRLEIRSAGVG